MLGVRDCPFCDRVTLEAFDGALMGGNVVHFEPLNPVTRGHRLFVPTSHVEHGDAGSGFAVGQAMHAAELWAAGPQSEHSDFNLITSSGPTATQTVPHIHIHYVPRVAGDGLQLPWGLPHG